MYKNSLTHSFPTLDLMHGVLFWHLAKENNDISVYHHSPSSRHGTAIFTARPNHLHPPFLYQHSLRVQSSWPSPVYTSTYTASPYAQLTPLLANSGIQMYGSSKLSTKMMVSSASSTQTFTRGEAKPVVLRITPFGARVERTMMTQKQTTYPSNTWISLSKRRSGLTVSIEEG